MYTVFLRRTVPLAAAAISSLAVVAQAQNAAPLPRKYIGPPTVAEITAGDLMTRLYKFADDSMMGRAVGTPWNDMGTAYVESEVRRLGLQPAGDNGTYFQKLPLYTRLLDSSSTVTVGQTTFKAGTDFTASAEDSRGHSRALRSFRRRLGRYHHEHFPGFGGGEGARVPSRRRAAGHRVEVRCVRGYQHWRAMQAEAAAYVVVVGESLTPQALRAAFGSAAAVFLQDTVP
jgi:hypothetical protein